MIVMKSSKIIEFPIYEDMQKEDFKVALDNLINLIKKSSTYKWESIGKNNQTLFEIINLVQKRRIYFHIFHQKEMGELNEISLICFWLLKLKPFYDKKNPRENVNLVFAITIFKQVIDRINIAKGKKIDFPTSHLLHAFKYRDLSKEAIMAIAESLIS